MGRKLEKGVTDLATTHPTLAAEWNYQKNQNLKTKGRKDISTPDEVMSGSKQKVWWICEYGHEWEATIQSRVSGNGCPYCSGKLPTNETSLATVRPDIALEWHPIKNMGLKNGNGRDISSPDKVTYGAHQKVWWLCNKCGYEWQATVNDRTSGYGCPCCAGKVVVAGKNLQTLFPDIAEEWDYEANNGLTDGNGRDISTPDKVSAGSGQIVSWICKNGHKWKSEIAGRTINGHGCPQCAGNLPIFNETDLASVHPEIAKEWHPTKNIGLMDGNGRDVSTPDKIASGSSLKVWWKCSVCDYEWDTSVSNRTTNNSGCPCCAGKVPLLNKTDLKAVDPELAKQWDFEKNRNLTDKTGRDISTPDKITANSNQKVWWKCEHGHSWNASVNNRRSGNGCPYCAGRKVCEDNNLKKLFPDVAAEWHPTKNGDLMPTDVTAGTTTRVWWQCEKGHEWKTSVNTRTNTGCGCPVCKESRGEKAIRKVLENNDIIFETQYKFKDRFFLSNKSKLRDDFAIFDTNSKIIATIEYHGRQHYEVVDFTSKNPEQAEVEFKMIQERDKVKTKYLQEHGIPQLIIPYTRFSDIPVLVNSFIQELIQKHKLL